MSRAGYRSLTIPDTLYKQLKQYVDASQGRYVSVSEVVREAIWAHLNNNSSPTSH
jgi:Arc/MetJ-type ribon-helix-helix transcriptional regulator